MRTAQRQRKVARCDDCCCCCCQCIPPLSRPVSWPVAALVGPRSLAHMKHPPVVALITGLSSEQILHLGRHPLCHPEAFLHLLLTLVVLAVAIHAIPRGVPTTRPPSPQAHVERGRLVGVEECPHVIPAEPSATTIASSYAFRLLLAESSVVFVDPYWPVDSSLFMNLIAQSFAPMHAGLTPVTFDRHPLHHQVMSISPCSHASFIRPNLSPRQLSSR